MKKQVIGIKNSKNPAGIFSNFPLGKRKKAAMELSVTAIVILILAIVMLGLGLGFIRGMFSKVSTQFEEQIATEPEPALPSGSEPITLSRESIVTHAKDAEVLKVSLYNPTNEDWDLAYPLIGCSSSLGNFSSLQVISKPIMQGETQSYNVLAEIPKSADPGTYLCSASIVSSNATVGYTKDFTIRVRR